MNTPKQRRGFTLVEIMVVVVIVGILSTIAIAGVVKVKDMTTRATVANNLRQIYAAKELYFTEGQGYQNGITAYSLHQQGYISNTLWASCYESVITYGYTYQGAFKPGAPVWAGSATTAPDGGTLMSNPIYYPAR